MHGDLMCVISCLNIDRGVGEISAAACAPCAAGTFSAAPGQSACDACPSGRFVATVGAASQNACINAY